MLKKLIRETVAYGSVNAFFSFVAFITFPLFARVLSVKDYGVLSLVETISGFASMFINLGINSSIQRYFFDPEIGNERRRTLLSTGLWGMLALAVIIVVSCCMFLLPFTQVLREAYGIKLSYIFLALLSLIPVNCLSYFADVFRLKFEPGRFAVVAFFQGLFGVILGLFFVIGLRRGLQGNFEGLFLGTLSGLAVGVFLIRKDFAFEYDHALFKKLLSFGIPFVFASLSMWFFSSTTRWMLASMTSVEESGVYAVAFKLSNIVTILNTAIGMAWAPFVFKLLGEDPEYRVKIVAIFDTMFFVVTAVAAFVSLFSYELLQILTPPVFWKAASPAVMLVMSVVFAMTQQVSALGISFEKRTHLILFGWAGIAVLNAGLNAVFIPLLASTGGALSTLVCNLLLSCFYLYCTQRLHPLPFNYRRILWYVASIFFFIAVAILANNILWTSGLIAVKLIMIATFFIASYKLEFFDRQLVTAFRFGSSSPHDL